MSVKTAKLSELPLFIVLCDLPFPTQALWLWCRSPRQRASHRDTVQPSVIFHWKCAAASAQPGQNGGLSPEPPKCSWESKATVCWLISCWQAERSSSWLTHKECVPRMDKCKLSYQCGHYHINLHDSRSSTFFIYLPNSTVFPPRNRTSINLVIIFNLSGSRTLDSIRESTYTT